VCPLPGCPAPSHAMQSASLLLRMKTRRAVASVSSPRCKHLRRRAGLVALPKSAHRALDDRARLRSRQQALRLPAKSRARACRFARRLSEQVSAVRRGLSSESTARHYGPNADRDGAVRRSLPSSTNKLGKSRACRVCTLTPLALWNYIFSRKIKGRTLSRSVAPEPIEGAPPATRMEGAMNAGWSEQNGHIGESP